MFAKANPTAIMVTTPAIAIPNLSLKGIGVIDTIN